MTDGPGEANSNFLGQTMIPAAGFDIEGALEKASLPGHLIHPGVTALRKLLDGYNRWVSGKPITYVKDFGRQVSPVEPQHPIATVITCSDSRLDFKGMLNQPLGRVFWCKTAANVSAYVTRSSIEYSIEHLKVPLLLILAHSHCGGVTAAVQATEQEIEGFSTDTQRMMKRIRKNIADISPASLQTPGDGMRIAVMANALAEMNRLVHPGESARDVSIDEHEERLRKVVQILQDCIDSGCDLPAARLKISDFVDSTIERRRALLKGESIIAKAVASGQLLLGIGLLDMETNKLHVNFPTELPGVPYPR